MENRFFRWRGIDANPTQIIPNDLLPQLPTTDSRYFVRILQHLALLLPNSGLTFFLTWHLDAFHEAMEDAVVLLVGDEQNQTPQYRHRVRAIFKTGGVRRSPIHETLRLPFPVAWRVLLRDSRDRAIRVRRNIRNRSSGRVVAPMFEIPFGPFALVEFNPLPVTQRPMDVFFAGGPISSRTLRAKFVARRQMTAAMVTARTTLPQIRTAEMGGAEASGKWLGPEAYTQSLASAKIALAPRGNCDAETYRIFEAAKLGCIIISEPLPPRWYYRGCPAVSIPDWSALPGVLRDLLNDHERLSQLSLRAREWWETMICEEAIAKFIAQSLAGYASALQKTT